MKISFCLPIYNVETFLEKCILSIENQNINEEYEIFCIDDCSTDKSFNKIKDLSKKYESIRIEKNDKNKGVSYTRNRLLKEAKG